MGCYEFNRIRDHIEVYDSGSFIFSADSISEAEKELVDYELDGQMTFDEVLG